MIVSLYLFETFGKKVEADQGHRVLERDASVAAVRSLNNCP